MESYTSDKNDRSWVLWKTKAHVGPIIEPSPHLFLARQQAQPKKRAIKYHSGVWTTCCSHPKRIKLGAALEDLMKKLV